MLKVIKRDCSEVEFDTSRIENAILKAMPFGEGVKPRIAKYIAEEIYEENKNKDEISIYEIEKMVALKLIARKQKNTALAYENYKAVKEYQRTHNTTDKDIQELLNRLNKYWMTENSNKNPVLNTTQRDNMAGIVSTDMTRRDLLPADIVQAHDEGIIHFHDADYFAQHMHNCFSSKTRFVTSRGVKSFSECIDGEELLVLAKDGTWKQATVHLYGKQSMQTVTLTSGRTKKKIKCTPDHRWILKDGTVTTNLSKGDRLCTLKHITTDAFPPINPDAFCLGFILGDGSDIVSPTSTGVKVRLCGKKTMYKDVFIKAGYSKSSQSFENGDIVMSKVGTICKKDFIKMHGWQYMSLNDKVSLFKGYYAADGSNDNRISTSNEDLLQMIRDISALAGYHICSEKKLIHSTNYKENAILYYIHFMTEQPDNRNWIVESIEKDNHGPVYEAWCVEEPETNSFTLDGGIVTGNCCLVNLEDMLQNSTIISETMIDSPKSFSTACNVATQAIAQIASSQYGGQSISLAHLAPFVQVSRQKLRKKVREEFAEIGLELDEEKINAVAELRVKEEINRGVQMIQYQVITLMTTNGQAPFITVFMYLNEVSDPQTKADLAAIIEEMLHQRILGVKNDRSVYVAPTFPKLIYVLEEDNIHEDSKYWYLTKLAAECSAKRLVPDYISEKKMLELKDGNTFPVMGCRSGLTVDRFSEEKGNLSNAGNFEKHKGHVYYGRFNQGVVTLNLVDVAMSSGGDMDKFWELMEQRTELCHRALRCRHERLLGTPSDVAPILWQDGALARLKKGEVIDPLLYDGYSTISLGYAGLYECVKFMTGYSHSDGGMGEKFAKEVMQLMNDQCDKWKTAENIDYSIYGTPLESTTYKFAKCLKKRFGNDIFVKLDGFDRNYITNSYHIPVFEHIAWYDKLSKEAVFQNLSKGGAISYIETPNMIPNFEVLLPVLQFIYDHIMYAELNTKSCYCNECGFDGTIELVDKNGEYIWECPNCGNTDTSTMNIVFRTCGYAATAKNGTNQGRLGDIHDRVYHIDDMEYKGE